jgi:hypothetical protein
VGDEGQSFGDIRPVPAGAVLLGEDDQRSVGPGAGRAAGVGEQHQRQQRGDLAVIREHIPQGAGEPDRLGGEVGALVALVEDQVQDVQHRAKPLRRFRGGRHPQPRARAFDALLGPADPLRHRRFGDKEGAGDLRGREAADGP